MIWILIFHLACNHSCSRGCEVMLVRMHALVVLTAHFLIAFSSIEARLIHNLLLVMLLMMCACCVKAGWIQSTSFRCCRVYLLGNTFRCWVIQYLLYYLVQLKRVILGSLLLLKKLISLQLLLLGCCYCCGSLLFLYYHCLIPLSSVTQLLLMLLAL